MTGGGLIVLVAYGAQNILLSGTPQMTYFYKAFRRYSHFSTENVTTAMDGPNELFFDQTIKVRAKIQRIGDLLSDMYFTFQLPDIYSKYVTHTPQRTSQFQFQWVRYIGAALINNAAFFVGGQKIQEFDGTYLMAKAVADYDADTFEKWRVLVGDTNELSDPAKGLYAGGTNSSGYPSVYPSSLPNRPSIFGQEVHVPLPFWFSDTSTQALPLVGLQLHDCEVQITLNPIEQLYTYLDASGFRVAPNFRMNSVIDDIRMNNPQYGTTTDLSGQIKNFLTDFGTKAPALNTWFFYPRIQSTYVYLPKEEQTLFATQQLSYLIYQTSMYPTSGLYNRQILDLETHNPITRLLFITQRSDAASRNDFSNFTNWWNYPHPPYLPTPGQTPINISGFSSGLLIPQGQLNTLRSLRVLCDGNEIQEEKQIDYFTKITPFRCISGSAKSLIPIYSFSLHSPSAQPSGSINASRIRNFQVEVDVYPLPVNTNYTYDLRIYVENINFFEVASGMGGLKYAL